MRSPSAVGMTDDELTIGQLAAQTGVGVSTLRMWETRYGTPVPRPLPGGHRRYSSRGVELTLEALRRREAGMWLPAALAAARNGEATSRPPSIYAGLRAARPDLPPVVFPKRVLTALAHAIEDE